MRPAWIETDLSAIQHNLRQIQQIVGPEVDIIAVVKSNGYGHGALPVARKTLEGRARMLAVALVEEAITLREGGIQAPILVLGATDPREADLFVQHRICPTVTAIQFAEALDAAASRANTAAPCHIKIDSGMGRQGIRPERVKQFARAIAQLPRLDIQGVFSHFASSPSDREFTNQQIDAFAAATQVLQDALGRPIPMRHIANSGAIIRHPNARFDAVRPGALIYGIAKHDSGEHWARAKQAMTLKARTVCVKPLKSGESVGYGRTYIAPADTTIAVLPIGYADGYPRALSNNADVLIRGKRCPVVGKVSMDCTMIDVGQFDDIAVGEEVVLMGRQADDIITVGELADRCDTCVEEIVSRMSPRLPRVYVDAESVDD